MDLKLFSFRGRFLAAGDPLRFVLRRSGWVLVSLPPVPFQLGQSLIRTKTFYGDFCQISFVLTTWSRMSVVFWRITAFVTSWFSIGTPIMSFPLAVM